MSYNDALLTLIDERIRAGKTNQIAMGTVATRDATGSRATVVFDGSALASPVKVFGNLIVRANDRVGLVRFGSDWVVVGDFSEWQPSENSIQQPMTSGTTTSTTYVDMPGPVSMPWVKERTSTDCEVTFSIGAYATVASAGDFAVLISGVDTAVGHMQFSQANTHIYTNGIVRISGLAAGTYTVTARWRRTAGTGTLTVDSNDWISLRCVEKAPRVTS